jgi:hypothetical protein
MFVLRSAFWLTVAFVVIAPKDVDLGATASDYSARAMAAGQQVIVSQVLANECSTVECIGTKAIVAAVLPKIPSVDSSMQDSSINDPVPFPRPRPDWMG